ncbi:hypothetical protein [Flavobacterium sp. MK4S-17]|uniref:hypothetical protein n=1 Tax=Flavobacterium sp. MK4S-17 TaxID=2543737 RepID=UPI001356C402|nr:hypothetical protein [Flavobacterium sp. MK4S-17]
MARGTFFKNITLKKAAIMTGLYILGGTLILMAMTDMFTQFKFQKEYSFLLIILVADTILIGWMWYRYLKNKKEGLN